MLEKKREGKHARLGDFISAYRKSTIRVFYVPMTLQDPGGLKEFPFPAAGIWAWVKVQRGESRVASPRKLGLSTWYFVWSSDLLAPGKSLCLCSPVQVSRQDS